MRYLGFLIGVIFFLFSCEKKENEQKENIVKESFVLAGIYDSSFYHKCFNPGFSIQLKQVGCWEMMGKDSLDLNNDGKYDLILTDGELNNIPLENCCPQSSDSTIIVDCWPSFYQYFQIALADSFELLSDTVNDNLYKISTSFIDTLNVNDTINDVNRGFSNQPSYFYTYNKPLTGGYGKWINIKSDKYVGFRFTIKGFKKYGWIRIEKIDKLIIKEIAYKK